MEPLDDAVEQVAQAAANTSLSPEELLQLYIVSFALASAAGLVRAHRDARYRDGWNLLSVAACGGFIGLALTLGLVWFLDGSRSDKPLFLLGAILVGLSGKEADRLPPMLMDWVLRRFGIELIDHPTRHPEDLDDDDLTGPQV